MNYIYDIYLNFQKKAYDFYDWNVSDRILHIRKIPIIKINTKDLKEIEENEIEFNLNFLKKDSKCEYYDLKEIKIYENCFLLTDGINISAYLLKNKEIYRSKILIFEEEDIINKIKNIKEQTIEYKKIKKLNIYYNLTRKEQAIYNEIQNYLNKLYENKEIEKIKYLYYECFNIKENNLNKIKENIQNHLNLDFNFIGKKIYNFSKIDVYN